MKRSQLGEIKPTQTALLLVILVVMVFAVTFASMYVRQPAAIDNGDDTGGEDPLATARLTFAYKTYPLPGENPPAVVTEFGKTGHHDFWFKNENDMEVRVGLNRTNCVCSGVKLWVAPDSWRDVLALAERRQLTLGAYGGGLAGHLAGPGHLEHVRKDLLARRDAPVPLAVDSNANQGLPVPARAVGFLRVEWEARDAAGSAPQPKNLQAEVWTQSPRAAPDQLKVTAMLVPVIGTAPTDLPVGALSPGGSAQADLHVWTATRPGLRLELRSTAAPFITARAEPMSETTLRNMVQAGVPAVAGYRVYVSVRERLEDGRRFDEGPFVHHLIVEPSDGQEKLPSHEVTVQGSVRGDVTVVGAENGVRLEPFTARRGTQHQVTLTTSRTDLRLELDRDRTSPFLETVLEKLPSDEAGRPRWRLRLAIGANKAAGTFPRADSELYRDSAVYLRIDGEKGRRLRIPVFGRAHR